MKIQSTMIQLHIYRRIGDKTEYLVLQRANDETIYPGLWQVVTGMVENNERAVDAVRREMKEETGLAPRSLIALPYVASFFNTVADTVNLVPVFAAETASNAEVLLSHEHQKFEWLPFDETIIRLPLPSHQEGTRILRDFILEGNFGAIAERF